MKIQFLGAARQVTGSCFYIETEGGRFLVDCGLFQERPFLDRNWAPFPVPPEDLDFVLLTHVHLDHSGLLPKLVREGFQGEILTTQATADLLPIVLLDSAKVQEEDAAYKRKRHQKEGRKPAHPEIPLYTEAEAARVTGYLKPVDYGKGIVRGRNITIRFHNAGHILGSAMIEISLRENRRTLRVLFSGDIGQQNKPLIHDPEVFDRAHALIMESTYGDRNHEDPTDVPTMLAEIIGRTADRGGNLVIPVFAVERAQELLFYLSRLIRQKRVPALPVFLDSPMAAEVTEIFLRHTESLDEEAVALLQKGESPFHFPGLRIIRTQEESKALNVFRRPAIILAGSGMCTGGRIKHHLRRNISRPETTVLFVGYQAAGTLGRQIVDGAAEVRILGETVPVRAKIAEIHAFSGHADRDDLLDWVGHFREPAPSIFLTHGEPGAAASLARAITERFGAAVHIPEYRDLWNVTS